MKLSRWLLAPFCLLLASRAALADDLPLRIRSTVRARYDQVRYCLWEELARANNPVQELRLRVRVASDGSIDATLGKETPNDLSVCVMTALNSARVPGWPAGVVRIETVPLRINPLAASTLPLSEIQVRLRGIRGALRTCTRKTTTPFTLSGTMVVGRRGFVRAVWQRVVADNGETTALRPVDRCLAVRLRGLRFSKPSPAGYVRVAFQFQFKRKASR